MTNGRAVTSVLLFCLVLIMLPMSIAEIVRVANMTQPQPQQVETAPKRSPSCGMAIMWRTPTQSGMSPQEVLASTVARMQHEQSTPLGSDRNARALVKAMEALAILDGRDIETADGFPIIE